MPDSSNRVGGQCSDHRGIFQGDEFGPLSSSRSTEEERLLRAGSSFCLLWERRWCLIGPWWFLLHAASDWKVMEALNDLRKQNSNQTHPNLIYLPDEKWVIVICPMRPSLCSVQLHNIVNSAFTMLHSVRFPFLGSSPSRCPSARSENIWVLFMSSDVANAALRS